MTSVTVVTSVTDGTVVTAVKAVIVVTVTCWKQIKSTFNKVYLVVHLFIND